MGQGNKTIYVNPRETSSECPACGNYDRDYYRNRLASLAITLRGIDLCGDPFPVSAVTSLPSVMDEYLYTGKLRLLSGTGRTEMAYVPNKCCA